MAADIERAVTPKGRAGVGCYVVEGLRLHERALRAGASVERVLVARSFLTQQSPRVATLIAGIESAGGKLWEVPDAEVDALTGERSAGIVGLVRLPQEPAIATLVGASNDAVLLGAVEVEDPGNVGALMRTALAAGAAGFLAVGISDPFHPKAVRTSMGAVAKLPIARFPDASSCLRALREAGAHAIGAVSRDGTPLEDYVPPAFRPVAVLMGGEAFGLEEAVVAELDGRVSIPQSAEVDSFSVNAAAAIVLYSLRVAPDQPKP